MLLQSHTMVVDHQREEESSLTVIGGVI